MSVDDACIYIYIDRKSQVKKIVETKNDFIL